MITVFALSRSSNKSTASHSLHCSSGPSAKNDIPHNLLLTTNTVKQPVLVVSNSACSSDFHTNCIPDIPEVKNDAESLSSSALYFAFAPLYNLMYLCIALHKNYTVLNLFEYVLHFLCCIAFPMLYC